MTNEQLEVENIELKADMKLVKEMCYQLAAIVGLVKEDGTVDDKFTIKKAMAEITGIITTSIMPNPFSTKKVVPLEERFAFLKSIIPLYDKYKHL